MDITQQYLNIRMIREHLEDIPEYNWPTGYSIRWYQPGDEKSWCRIHLLADKYTDVTLDLHEKEFFDSKGSASASSNSISGDSFVDEVIAKYRTPMRISGSIQMRRLTEDERYTGTY